MTPTTDTVTRTTTRTPVGPEGRDFGWEKAVISHWCGVQILDIDVGNTVRAFGPNTVAIIEIILTAGTTRDAQALAGLLDLPPTPSDPAVAWQSWTGWVSALSAQQPVLVTVTAPTSHQEA
ncbi:hypothetical protein ACFT2C_05295 [Promicromonospora sp. NPDC057138]|uniref:hypothetical protein n=1 Tax=Promicromonospora sp. NPDC057138 TaxID=3346031 RepID=UPI003638F523